MGAGTPKFVYRRYSYATLPLGFWVIGWLGGLVAGGAANVSREWMSDLSFGKKAKELALRDMLMGLGYL